jgi:cob(I)alamin adenosyltransferase
MDTKENHRKGDGYLSGNFKDLITGIMLACILYASSTLSELNAELKLMHKTIETHTVQIKEIIQQVQHHIALPGHDVALQLHKSNDDKYNALNESISRVWNKLDKIDFHKH